MIHLLSLHPHRGSGIRHFAATQRVSSPAEKALTGISPSGGRSSKQCNSVWVEQTPPAQTYLQTHLCVNAWFAVIVQVALCRGHSDSGGDSDGGGGDGGDGGGGEGRGGDGGDGCEGEQGKGGGGGSGEGRGGGGGGAEGIKDGGGKGEAGGLLGMELGARASNSPQSVPNERTYPAWHVDSCQWHPASVHCPRVLYCVHEPGKAGDVSGSDRKLSWPTWLLVVLMNHASAKPCKKASSFFANRSTAA